MAETIEFKDRDGTIKGGLTVSGAPGLVGRVFAVHVGISAPTCGTCPNNFFQSNRPGYPHPVCSELENSDIGVGVGDFCVTERRRWRLPYQNGKTVHMHAGSLQT